MPEDRLAIRDHHLEYMIAGKHRVAFGGPVMVGATTTGVFLLLFTRDVDEASAFMRLEPYRAAGLFESEEYAVVEQFITEPRDGFLDDLLADARVTARYARRHRRSGT